MQIVAGRLGLRGATAIVTVLVCLSSQSARVADAQVTQPTQPRTTIPTVTDGTAHSAGASVDPSGSNSAAAGNSKNSSAHTVKQGEVRRNRTGNGEEIPQQGRDMFGMPAQPVQTPLPISQPTQSPDLRNQINQLGMSMAQGLPARAITPLALPQGRRPGSGVPSVSENRLILDQVVVEVAQTRTPQEIAALAGRQGLTLLEQFASQLSGTRMLLLRIDDQSAVAAKLRALEADAAVLSAQPNYLFALQDSGPKGDQGEPLQYAVMKLHLTEAHQLTEGDHVLVAVIDSGVDNVHPELSGSIAENFDATGKGMKPDSHGTAVAGSIVAHGRLTGSAPKALILAVQAFNAVDAAPQGTTFNILKGLDWAAVKGAQVINMSFAGPPDPAMHRSLESAFNNAIVLVAAAGNAGPKSPPLFPGADSRVVAVTATDAGDRIFAASNRGPYIGVAAPGVDVLLAAPDNAYRIASGTSFSAAEVSGIAALILERQPGLPPGTVRTILLATGKALGGPGAPRLANAFQALSPASGLKSQLQANR